VEERRPYGFSPSSWSPPGDRFLSDLVFPLERAVINDFVGVFVLKSSYHTQNGGGDMNLEVEVEVGSAAPDFKLPAHTGGEIALSDYRGKKVALFFVREYI
jgi:hypothetical protein